MPTITLTVTDTELRVLTALEQIDTKTLDERFSVYMRDIVRNGAGIDCSRSADAVEAAVLALEAEATAVLTGAKAVSLPEAPAEAPSATEPVQELVEVAETPKPVNEPDPPIQLFELTPPEPVLEPTPAIQHI